MPDYVFEKDYALPTLTEVEEYIKANKHLLGIPPAKEVEENGLYLDELSLKLLEKVEELTLYLIEQQKQLKALEVKNQELMNKIEQSKKSTLKQLSIFECNNHNPAIMYHLKYSILFWIYLALCVSFIKAQSQVANPQQSESMSMEDAAMFVGKKVSGLNVSLPDWSKLAGLGQSAFDTVFPPYQISNPSVQGAFETYFLVGDSAVSGVYPARFLNRIQVGYGGVSFLNIPLQGNATITLESGKFNKDLSALAISFDQNAYLENLGKQYFPNYYTKDLLDVNNNPLQLTENEIEALQKEARYSFFQQVVTHPKYIAYRSRIMSKFDSIAALEDTTIFIPELHSIRNQLDTIKLLESAYLELWEYKKMTGNAWYNSVQEKLHTYRQEYSNFHHGASLKDSLQTKTLTAKQRLLLLTKDFSLGLSFLDESDFTIKHTAVNGFKYAYEDQHIVSNVAYGRQHLPYQTVSNYLVSNTWQKKMLYADVGIQSNTKEYVKIRFMQINDSLLNQVIALGNQKSIAHQQVLVSEIAFSAYGNKERAAKNQAERSALDVKWQFQPENKPVTIGIGYFRIGSNFVSLGNLFLFTNRQGASLNIAARLLKDKLQLQLDGRIGTPIDEQLPTARRDWQLLGVANYTYGKQNLISLQVLPNQYYQGTYENRLKAAQYIYTLQHQMVHSIKKNQLISILQVTNVRSGFDWIDSLQINKSVYAYWQERFMFSNGNVVGTALQVGTDEALLEVNYEMVVGKITLMIGGQLLEQQQLKQYGGILGFRCAFGKQFDLEANTNFRRGSRIIFW
ncbi:MAG: hypothetical protein HC892_22670 [Saprospiraceae bacterium]|nr:hypothetical protein [Saprospiraceae bacterium]